MSVETDVRREVLTRAMLLRAKRNFPLTHVEHGLRAGVVGVGAVGSFAALALSKMGFSLSIWDADTVEAKNVANQLYGPPYVGVHKSDAMHRLLSLVGTGDVRIFNRGITGMDTVSNGILVVCAVDSMAARSLAYRTFVKNSRNLVKPFMYTDIRMGMNGVQIYNVVSSIPGARAEYEASLYGDEEAENIPCDAQASIVSSMLAGTFVAREVQTFLRWRANRDLPLPHKFFAYYGDHDTVQAFDYKGGATDED